jgi:hypothetical protein
MEKYATFLKVISERPWSFFSREKSTQKPAREPMFPWPSFIHPRLFTGRHHPWSFDWLPSLGFRSRPLFFIPEKKRRRRHP